MAAPIFAVVEEHFHQIAARCLDDRPAGASRAVAVSSANPGEGTTSVAVGIALAAARNSGTSALVLETDMQHPRLAEACGLARGVGLREYLAGEAELDRVIQPMVPNVWLLPAGAPTSNPGPLIRSQRFQELMKILHGRYQTIIVDVPPLLTSSHAVLIANQADSLVLVARAGRTHIQDAAKALAVAGDVPVKGMILNGTRSWLPDWLTRFLCMPRFAID